jgi:predicted Ser/Thr protein kinase
MRSSDDQSMELQPGTIVTGRYEIVKRLGRGSMGFVYACRDREHAGRLVAMKVLFQDFAKDKTGAARFRNEILAAFEVHHENVMSAYEYIRDGGITAYTMEYVGGGDLAERISKGEQLPLHDILRLLSQMAGGVEAIHRKGIIHRDLKPENILLTTTGDVKIADFGIARMGHGPKLTEHGGVVGTIDYVSPEYMLRGQVDHRSDIYALGILAYEMLTGSSPFQGDSVYATMTKRLKQDPTPPSQVRPDCPPELDRIVLKAMEREPEARYQAAIEMQVAVDGLRAELGFMDVASTTFGDERDSVGAGIRVASSRVVRVGLDGDDDAGSGAAGELGFAGPGEDLSVNGDPLARYIDEPAVDAAPPMKMEPLLNRSGVKRVGTDWSRPAGAPAQSGNVSTVARQSAERSGLPSGSLVARAGLPSHKLRSLSVPPPTKQKSWIHDVVLALIMLFVGVGFGFAVISVVLPNFFGGESAPDATTVLREENF